jgi:hypothetical protein
MNKGPGSGHGHDVGGWFTITPQDERKSWLLYYYHFFQCLCFLIRQYSALCGAAVLLPIAYEGPIQRNGYNMSMKSMPQYFLFANMESEKLLLHRDALLPPALHGRASIRQTPGTSNLQEEYAFSKANSSLLLVKKTTIYLLAIMVIMVAIATKTFLSRQRFVFWGRKAWASVT